MIALVEAPPSISRFKKQIQQAFRQYHAQTSMNGVERVVMEIPSLDIFSWLAVQTATPKIYWKGRDDTLQIAAVGNAMAFQSKRHDARMLIRAERMLNEASIFLRNNTETRIFGGIRFDSLQEANTEWQDFGTYYFALPRFELHQEEDKTTLICNLVFPQDAENLDVILHETDELQFPSANLEDTFSPIYEHRYEPKQREWHQKISWLLTQFAKGDLHKVVLARKTLLHFAKTFNPAYLFKLLVEAKPDCFHFYFQPTEQSAFLAATPERLYQRNGNQIYSEAVAGTRPCGEDDTAMANELLTSEKDRREHEYVRQIIEEVLSPLCETLDATDETKIMKLKRRMHLWAKIEGTLKNAVTDIDLIRALHPTPAVGGHPTSDAISTIAALEPFDRGWYAGPIGWIGANAAEFAVGIRSGLVYQDSLSLYSGAGIVEGSTPEGEWAEIEQKISDFLAILGLESLE